MFIIPTLSWMSIGDFMNYRESFSNHLSQLRKIKNLSMKDLGNIIGMSDEAIRLLEKGKRSPSFEVLCALADYFDVSLDYLVGRTDNPDSHKR